MPRPVRCRRVAWEPESDFFKPRGVPARELETIGLTMDELEALRLADLEGLYQEEGARRMDISRQTFGNVLACAHRKVANALVNSKALRIQGGVVEMVERHFVCYDCKHEWALPHGSGRRVSGEQKKLSVL